MTLILDNKTNFPYNSVFSVAASSAMDARFYLFLLVILLGTITVHGTHQETDQEKNAPLKRGMFLPF